MRILGLSAYYHDSAACLVAGGKGPDRELERLLARQARGAGTKPILELNMRHPVVRDGALERRRHVGLDCHGSERFRSVLAGEGDH